MSITEIKEYLNLCLMGKSSIPERQKILDIKLCELEHKKEEIEEAITFVKWKQNFYQDVIVGRTKYFSNLTSTEGDDQKSFLLINKKEPAKQELLIL